MHATMCCRHLLCDWYGSTPGALGAGTARLPRVIAIALDLDVHALFESGAFGAGAHTWTYLVFLLLFYVAIARLHWSTHGLGPAPSAPARTECMSVCSDSCCAVSGEPGACGAGTSPTHRHGLAQSSSIAPRADPRFGLTVVLVSLAKSVDEASHTCDARRLRRRHKSHVANHGAPNPPPASRRARDARRQNHGRRLTAHGTAPFSYHLAFTLAYLFTRDSRATFITCKTSDGACGAGHSRSSR